MGGEIRGSLAFGASVTAEKIDAGQEKALASSDHHPRREDETDAAGCP
jgi:hypothetical protein